MLLEYNPAKQTTHCVMDGLWFANGVAMPADGSFVLVAESHHLKIWKYWLTGPQVCFLCHCVASSNSANNSLRQVAAICMQALRHRTWTGGRICRYVRCSDQTLLISIPVNRIVEMSFRTRHACRQDKQRC